MNEQSMAKIDIFYCNQCNWMLRSAWLMQELLQTFQGDIEVISLHPDTGGRFEVFCNDQRIWSRVDDGGFPDAKTLKRKVRDIICPDEDLGHIDR